METKTNKSIGQSILIFGTALAVFMTLGVSLDSHYRQGKKIDQLELSIRDKNTHISVLKEDINQASFDYFIVNQNLEKAQGEIETLKEENKQIKADNKEMKDENKKLKKQLNIQQEEEKKVQASNVKVDTKKEVEVKATAYTAYCKGCSGITRTGLNLRANPQSKVIAVDPTVIPLGSKVYVEGYGYATASDTGGAIKGRRIDIFKPNLADAKKWGVQNVTVRILK